MFFDFRTRGSDIAKTQFKTEKRIEIFFLILGFAMIFATLVYKRKPLQDQSKKQKRSLTSIKGVVKAYLNRYLFVRLLTQLFFCEKMCQVVINLIFKIWYLHMIQNYKAIV